MKKRARQKGVRFELIPMVAGVLVVYGIPTYAITRTAYYLGIVSSIHGIYIYICTNVQSCIVCHADPIVHTLCIALYGAHANDCLKT